MAPPAISLSPVGRFEPPPRSKTSLRWALRRRRKVRTQHVLARKTLIPIAANQNRATVLTSDTELVILWNPQHISDGHNPSTREPLKEVKIYREHTEVLAFRERTKHYRRMVVRVANNLQKLDTDGVCPNGTFYKPASKTLRFNYWGHFEGRTVFQVPKERNFILWKFFQSQGI